MSAIAELSQLELNIPDIPPSSPVENEAPKRTSEQRREAIGGWFRSMTEKTAGFFAKATPVVDYILEIDEHAAEGAKFVGQRAGEAFDATAGAAFDALEAKVIEASDWSKTHIEEPLVESYQNLTDSAARNAETLRNNTNAIVIVAVEGIKATGRDLDESYRQPVIRAAEDIAASSDEFKAQTTSIKSGLTQWWNNRKTSRLEGKIQKLEDKVSSTSDEVRQTRLQMELDLLKQELEEVSLSTANVTGIARRRAALHMEKAQDARDRVRNARPIRSFFSKMLARRQRPSAIDNLDLRPTGAN